MRIGGIVKQSFIDWEGKVTTVVFTRGCNFRCGYCHNPSLVLPHLLVNETDIPENQLFDYLKTRREWLDGVVVTGGEPTIHADLESFLEAIKNLGYLIKLDTNGSNPMFLKKLLARKLVDFVAMDVKTVLDLGKYQQIIGANIPDLIRKIDDSIQILNASNIDFQLRTTLIPKYHSPDIIQQLQTQFSYCNYQLQEFRAGDTIENRVVEKKEMP
ncbi:MAG: anaerobic ribonucleoside-triphosphate reductase activating protein [Salinivirgaceae bacterium]|nr:anaerobic ribonucleoside-triphosphate reductase activating protein [Salinivirgaceae bacterium]MDD4746990.1 anaerobic ribonucleoside-triphosphate reductase activating protein [Salinivirgaceae bacterium]